MPCLIINILEVKIGWDVTGRRGCSLLVVMLFTCHPSAFAPNFEVLKIDEICQNTLFLKAVTLQISRIPSREFKLDKT